jgi:hypothetical protein
MRFRSLGGAMAGRQKTLEQEIRTLVLIIETNQAAMRLATISKADKAHLLRSLSQRRARLALLQEQLAARPRSN